MKVLGTGCLSLLEDIQIIYSLLFLLYSFGSILYHCIYGCMFCMILFNFANYVFLFLYMFCSVYSVSLCCSVYCLCVNVYCTTATGCQTQLQLTNISYNKFHCFTVHFDSLNFIHTNSCTFSYNHVLVF